MTVMMMRLKKFSTNASSVQEFHHSLQQKRTPTDNRQERFNTRDKKRPDPSVA